MKKSVFSKRKKNDNSTTSKKQFEKVYGHQNTEADEKNNVHNEYVTY